MLFQVNCFIRRSYGAPLSQHPEVWPVQTWGRFDPSAVEGPQMLAGRDGQSFTIGVFEEFSTRKKYFLIFTTLESCGCSNGLNVAVYSKWMTMYNGSDLRPGPYFVQQGFLAKRGAHQEWTISKSAQQSWGIPIVSWITRGLVFDYCVFFSAPIKNQQTDTIASQFFWLSKGRNIYESHLVKVGMARPNISTKIIEEKHADFLKMQVVSRNLAWN